MHPHSALVHPTHTRLRPCPPLHAFPAHDTGNSMPKPTYSPVRLHLPLFSVLSWLPLLQCSHQGKAPSSKQDTASCVTCNVLIIAKILWKTEKKTVKDSKMCGKEMIIRILQRSICTMQHSCTGDTLSVRHHGSSSYSLMPWSIQHMLASRMGSISGC
jgi:hypothetical protein